AQARMIVLKAELRLVQARDGSNEAQAETRTRRVAARFQTYEPLGDARPLLGRNSRAVVGDHERWPRLGLLEGDGHLAAGRRVFDRVVDEIGERLGDEIAVAVDGEALGRLLDEEAQMPLLG